MNQRTSRLIPWLFAITITLSSLLAGCSLPQVSAEQRIFLDLSLEFLGEYQLPKMTFKDTPVGGLSALAYDRRSDRFYALSDDASRLAPARFYTLKLDLNDTGIQNVTVENVTFLKNENGQTYPKDSIDPEGIALTPQKTVFISSEGAPRNGIAPSVREFDLQTGHLLQSLPIPDRYVPDGTGEKQQIGIRENFGFEALTLNPTGLIPASGEPIRLFTATESALLQDFEPPNTTPAETKADTQTPPRPLSPRSRLLHYLIGEGEPILIAEHFYALDPEISGNFYPGLTDLLALDQSGHFLSLERSLGFFGFTARIYQAATGGATDTSRIASLKGELQGVNPVRKKLLFDLNGLEIVLDNLEGMALGPRFPDGSQSLVLVSDNNFKEEQVTQFLLFRLKGSKP